MKSFIGILFPILSGCATVGNFVTDVADLRRPPAADFPKLDVLVTYVMDRDVGYQQCGSTANGCLTFDFAANQCVISLLDYSLRTPTPPYVIAHADIERQCMLGSPRLGGHCWRCIGYNSKGKTDTADAWESYKRSSSVAATPR